MTRPVLTGRALAGAAVLVSLARHLVASRHQAGLPAPSGPGWTTLVDLSAVAWAVLEALTLFYLWSAYSQTGRRYLVGFMVVILGLIGLTNTPPLVADAGGQTLVELLGAATPALGVWAFSAIIANGAVVLAAGAADAAIESLKRRGEMADHLRERDEEIAGLRQRLMDLESAAAIPAEIDAPRVYTLRDLSEIMAQKPGNSSTFYATLCGVSSQAVRARPEWETRSWK